MSDPNQENAELDVIAPPEPELADVELEVEEEDEEDEVSLEIKEIVQDSEVFNNAGPQAPPKQEVIKKKVKRPPSEKQLAHLAKIRGKALEARQAKAQAKKGVSINEDSNQTREVKAIPREPTQAELGPSLRDLTPDDLRKLQMEAIYGYDMMRKDRKKKKQEALETQRQQKEVERAVNRHLPQNSISGGDDPWGICFN